MKPHFFKTPGDSRQWLEKNHETTGELLVGYYKKGTGKESITWPESVEQALCFGWIDGVRRTVDDESYSIRFTPRRAGSIWSTVNINKMKEMLQKSLVYPAGIAAFERRQENKSEIYGHEKNGVTEFPSHIEKEFKANKNAWKFFNEQPPYYKKTITHWVSTAKQEKTQFSRLEKLVAACNNGERLR